MSTTASELLHLCNGNNITSDTVGLKSQQERDFKSVGLLLEIWNDKGPWLPMCFGLSFITIHTQFETGNAYFQNCLIHVLKHLKIITEIWTTELNTNEG